MAHVHRSRKSTRAAPEPINPVLMGAIIDPRETDRVVRQSNDWYGTFGDAAPAAMSVSDTTWEDTFLWDAEMMILGELLKAFHQTLGTCVSQGWGRFIQDLLFWQMVEGEMERWVAGVATEPIYIGSRIEVGRGQLGGGQGSHGAWAGDFLLKWGVLFRLLYGSYDLRTPNDNWAQQLGSSRDGLPAALEAAAKTRPLRTMSVVRSAQEAAVAIAVTKRGVPICSNVGFTNRRDAEGFDTPYGVWNHCMYLRGFFVHKRRGPCFIIQQSWGAQPAGPDKVECKSGRIVQLPQGCFAVEWNVVERITKQGTSHTGAGVRGFVARKVKTELVA